MDRAHSATCILLVTVFAVTSPFAVRVHAADPATLRWEPTIQRFEEQDAVEAPPENAVVFAGSSSIVFWRSLADDMAPLTTINRGFGGSQMHQLNYYRDRIITKYKPRMVVVYEGDNDIAASRTVEQVMAEFEDFIVHMGKALPDTQICFIAIKPSLAREHL